MKVAKPNLVRVRNSDGHCTCLTLEVIATRVVARVGNKVGVVLVDEPERTVVDRDGGDAHVIRVHHAVREAHREPGWQAIFKRFYKNRYKNPPKFYPKISQKGLLKRT